MAKTNPKKKTSNLTKYNRAGYFFVAPFVIVFLIFSVYPVFRTLVLSFTDSKLAGMPYHFVGLKNFQMIFQDIRVRGPFLNTLEFAVFLESALEYNQDLGR